MHSSDWLQIRRPASTRSGHTEDHAVVRTCGGCTLCCKVPAIPTLEKKSNEWCKFCNIGNGCAIYNLRPQVCIDFHCLWLNSNQPEEWRPDRVNFYAVEESDELVKIRVDGDHPAAWREGVGKQIVDHFQTEGKHVLIDVGMQ